MTNRNSLLGRSRPREKLTREEIAATYTLPADMKGYANQTWGNGDKGET